MNPRLTPTQIDEIFDAADHVDVPVEQLLSAAAEIRATLLAASGDITLLTPAASVDDEVRFERANPVRRARVVRTALVAATLALATLLSAAVTGALPASLQDQIAQVANVFGIDVPRSDSSAAGEKSTGSQVLTGTGSPRAAAATTSTDPTEPTTVTTAGPVAADAQGRGPSASPGLAFAYGPGEGDLGRGNGPPDTPTVANGNGPPDDPGQGIGNGPPEEPGTPNGNGPPDDPGQGIGNGPPAEPGTGNGNGNNPHGPGA